MNTRITVGDDGRNVDDYLEGLFQQIMEWDVEGEEAPAIERVLQPYTTSLFGKSGVSCQGIITDPDRAFLWVSQFGELRIASVDANTRKLLRKQFTGYEGEINFVGQIGPDHPNHKRVFARTVHQIALLAGIQVLRETADKTLNTDAASYRH